MRFGVPFSITRIFLMFGFQVLLARRDTWLLVMLILWPVLTDLSQILHLAISFPPVFIIKRFDILSERTGTRKFFFVRVYLFR